MTTSRKTVAPPGAVKVRTRTFADGTKVKIHLYSDKAAYAKAVGKPVKGSRRGKTK